MAFTVTATQGGNTATGMVLRIFVLTQAAATQNGATASASIGSLVAIQASITTTQAGSRVYGAAVDNSESAGHTANSSTTALDNILDAGNGETYCTFKATSLTGTPGATTLGYTTTTASGGTAGIAMLEVLTAGTLTEDGSAPATASTTSATSVTTASFTPPNGSLLVALVASDGAVGGTVTISITDTSGLGLTWVEKIKQNNAGESYAGVWIAQMPAAGTVAGKLQPWATVPVPRRRLARAIVQRIIGRPPPAAPNKEPPLIPRARPPRRAFARFITGQPPPAAPNREPPPGPRSRPPRRAFVQHVAGSFPPAVTLGTANREPFQPSWARRPQRAVTRSIMGTSPPAVTRIYRQPPGLPAARRPTRAVVLSIRPLPAPAAGAGRLATADYDGKTWWKKRWILRL